MSSYRQCLQCSRLFDCTGQHRHVRICSDECRRKRKLKQDWASHQRRMAASSSYREKHSKAKLEHRRRRRADPQFKAKENALQRVRRAKARAVRSHTRAAGQEIK